MARLHTSPLTRPGWVVLFLAIVLPAAGSRVLAQVDTTGVVTDTLQATDFPLAAKDPVAAPALVLDRRTPRGALWRALVVPGWGQVYNGHYLKLPLVYAGLGGMTGFAFWLNNRYLEYRHAFLYIAFLDEEGGSDYIRYKPVYDGLVRRLGYPPDTDLPAEALRTQRDLFRRNRDLAYLGIGLVYGLVALDAYVSAHLLHFDVSEDLSVYVVPVPNGAVAALRLGF